MFRQIFQFLNLISLKDLPKAKDHYLDIEVIKQYQKSTLDGLYPDELETLDFWKNSNIESLLIFGAGAGREALAFSDYSQTIVGFEPSSKMYEGLKVPSKIKFVSSLDQIEGSFDIIFVSAFVLNFMTHKERNDFYDLIHRHLKKSGMVFVRPDIMLLTIHRSFKFFIASLFLKIRFLNLGIQKGDTIRSTIDKNISGKKLIFYHYFESKQSFEKELSENNFHFQFLKEGYYLLRPTL